MEINIKLQNKLQEEFFRSNARNQCASGGFNNGKSYVGCLKTALLCNTFPNYRSVIARQVHSDLMKTTYQTFFKIVPRDLVASDNKQDGVTILKNGSTIYWMHLDKVEASTLRGLEINSVLVDQAEEIEEATYDVLDARIGRWDKAIVPDYLLKQFPDWPRNPNTGNYIVPSYHMLLCNPDTQFHFIYRKYHPHSLQRRENYFYVEGEWDPNLSSTETYSEALKHDQEWIDKYIKGGWGVSNAQIHRIRDASLLDYNEDLIARIKRQGNLFRAMDHGESSPTCCLWFAVLDGVYICYREYYAANAIISDHRKAINDLSEGEIYSASYADPSIFDTESKKRAGFWSVADEYLTKSLPTPPISWIPADNNEFATRNRINELLRPSDKFKHPITKESPAPGIYFIKKNNELYPNGCYRSIEQVQSQRRELIGYMDGKAIYDDKREETVSDHAYDPIRYFVAMHSTGLTPAKRLAPRNSLSFYKKLGMMKKSGPPVAASVR